MKRFDMINTVGKEYFTPNLETDEFSYHRAYKEKNLTFKPIKAKNSERKYSTIDLRFVKDNLTVLIETKDNFSDVEEAAEEQLSAYVTYERGLNNNKIIAILANTTNGPESNTVKVWRGTVSDRDLLKDENILQSIDHYKEFYSTRTNNKAKVIKNTYALNELLHSYGIREKLRSQFVGTCLLVLKNTKSNLISKDMNTNMILAEMKHILETLLSDDLNKAEKLSLLDKNVLDSQDIRSLSSETFRNILTNIKEKIMPYINDQSTAGQDLLNLFFVTFNKYVGKDDKNQAFTPDHITDFMAKALRINRNSVVLDPTCGSGSFLVRAMTQALDDANTEEEQERIKKHQLYGIEYDENIYGLATTNMLIHGDGNSNIIQGSCFNLEQDIEKWEIENRDKKTGETFKIDKVLMNPPYNATKAQVPSSYSDSWNKKNRKPKADPSKGLYFVKYIAHQVQKGDMAVLLPMAAAIGNNKTLAQYKKDILEENTLKAVFSLPDDIFYPGASVPACCMIFELGVRHDSSIPTFFGYYKDDGFVKRKNLGRVEKVNEDGIGAWEAIEKEWLDLYRRNKEVVGKSTTHCVTADDEWLAEAYMKTDYSKLTQDDFQQTVNDYLSYLVKEGRVYEA